ncbi:MAG: class I SAM-dependent methyltransferase [Chloroflexota bacterium]
MQHVVPQSIPGAGSLRSGSPSSDAEDIRAYYHEIAPFYDAEQADRSDLRFWRRLAESMPGSDILELGAGSGMVTAQCAPAARRLLAVDLSPDLLQLARQRLRSWPQVELAQADMRALDVADSFDLIVAANDPISHLTADQDRDQVLHVVANHLAPGGRFVLDALWLPPEDARAVVTAAGRVKAHSLRMDGRTVRVRERWRRDPGQSRRCSAQYVYSVPGHRSVTAEFQARDWSLPEVRERFAHAGLRIVSLWGSYTCDAWHPDRSTRLIVVAGLPS